MSVFDSMGIPELRESITKMSDEIQGVFKAHTDGEKGTVRFEEVSADESDKLRDLNQKLSDAQERFEKLQELSGFADDAAKLSRYMKEPVSLAPASPKPPAEIKSLGRAFIESEHFTDWRSRKGAEWEVKAERKAVIGEDAALADVGSQYAVQNIRTGIVVDTLYQANNIAPLIPSITTSQAAVPYMQETVTSTGAAEAAEGALAAEADLSWAEATSPVRKIAVSLPVTEELLMDVPAIRGIVDQRLRLFMNNREDVELLKGDGIAPNLTGILSTAGLGNTNYSLTTPTAQGFAESIFQSANLVRTGFQNPTQIVLNTGTLEYIALAKDSQLQYLFPGLMTMENPRLWGLPVIVNENMDAYGTLSNVPVLVGDFRGAATVFRRAGVSLSVTDSHSDRFLRDILTIKLAERLALVVWRPTGFATVTRTA